jgi:hypothetical protein
VHLRRLAPLLVTPIGGMRSGTPRAEVQAPKVKRLPTLE